MQSQEVHKFLVDYFRFNQCEIIENSGNHLAVQLTVEVDKQLMNRHFYWHYLDQTGGEPKTTLLNLHTRWDDISDIEGEAIHFGSPRLHQIFQSCKQMAQHIRLYENCQAALYPWLCMNMVISYLCDQQKSKYVSLALNLINGEIIEDFSEKVHQLHLSPRIAELSYTLHPFITLNSGIKRLEKYVTAMIDSEESKWADQANLRMREDLRLLEGFYLEKNEQYHWEYQSIQNLYEPKITIKTINGGLFYLSSVG